jgi:hypothetical protein
MASVRLRKISGNGMDVAIKNRLTSAYPSYGRLVVHVGKRDICATPSRKRNLELRQSGAINLPMAEAVTALISLFTGLRMRRSTIIAAGLIVAASFGICR